jgi:membrane protein involved in colicin uptake
MKTLSYILIPAMMVTTLFAGEAQAQERKPVSPQAKGAIIGGLGGAAAGAIIHKRNRVVGGAVGAAAGAGTGYMVGRNINNRRKAETAEANRVAAVSRANAAERRAEAERAERQALARRAAAAEKKAELAQAKLERQQQATAQAPAMANGFAAQPTTGMMYNLTGTTATGGMASAYLPNDTYGQRNAAYPTSEYRRKSW